MIPGECSVNSELTGAMGGLPGLAFQDLRQTTGMQPVTRSLTGYHRDSTSHASVRSPRRGGRLDVHNSGRRFCKIDENRLTRLDTRRVPGRIACLKAYV